MSESDLETFVRGVRPDAVPIVRALADAVGAADPKLARWIAYRMLLYGPEAHRREWTCAIGVSTKAVNLRFLHGTSMADPAGLMRPGTSTLKTIDYRTPDEVDPAIVTAYVREALSLHIV